MALDPVWFGILSTEMMFPMLRDPILANADQVASAGSFWLDTRLDIREI